MTEPEPSPISWSSSRCTGHLPRSNTEIHSILGKVDMDKPVVINPLIAKQLLAERGVVYVEPDTLKGQRMLGVLVSEEVMDLRHVEGTDSDNLLEAKDNILRELDTRLTKLLGL